MSNSPPPSPISSATRHVLLRFRVGSCGEAARTQPRSRYLLLLSCSRTEAHHRRYTGERKPSALLGKTDRWPPAESRPLRACATCERHDPPCTASSARWPTTPETSSNLRTQRRMCQPCSRRRWMTPQKVPVTLCNRYLSACLRDVCCEDECLLAKLRFFLASPS